MNPFYIVGYGKMGQAVERACQARNLPTKPVDDFAHLTDLDFAKDDVAIEFTQFPGCLENFEHLLSRGVTVVSGTTGWADQESRVRDMVNRYDGAFLSAANFSIGVHLFWRLVERAAVLFNTQESYDVFTHEVHHPHKKDAPSGTALHTARILLGNMARKKHIVSGDVAGPLAQDALHISASRGGFQAGEHSVYFDGPDDMITLSHHAKGRDGFANGALDCALWLKGKKGFFTIDDYIRDILP